MSNPKGKGWVKCPSVTYGGKPYFWYRRDESGIAQWYKWNRKTKQWEYQHDNQSSRERQA